MFAFFRLGQPCEFLIDTTNAGAGALAVTVDGPSKVQLDCREVAEGRIHYLKIVAHLSFLVIVC